MSKPNLVYVGHSYHRVTGSSAFFLELLRRSFEVTVLWDESWEANKPAVEARQINLMQPDIVLFYQLIPKRRELAQIACTRLFLVPMHDCVVSLPLDSWRKILGSQIRIISFCRATHAVFTRLGFESLSVQYWPQVYSDKSVETDSGLKIFFWARKREIGWRHLKLLLGNIRPDRIIFRVAADPGESVDLPDTDDLQRFHIELVHGWLDKTTYDALLNSCNIFMAPRLFEGIGHSFLEAMAQGIAVIAPDSPTMNEYISHNRDGYLYSFNTPMPLDFSRLDAVRAQAINEVAAGQSRWRADQARIISLLQSPVRRSSTLHWRLRGWLERVRGAVRAHKQRLSNAA